MIARLERKGIAFQVSMEFVRFGLERSNDVRSAPEVNIFEAQNDNLATSISYQTQNQNAGEV